MNPIIQQITAMNKILQSRNSHLPENSVSTAINNLQTQVNKFVDSGRFSAEDLNAIHTVIEDQLNLLKNKGTGTFSTEQQLVVESITAKLSNIAPSITEEDDHAPHA